MDLSITSLSNHKDLIDTRISSINNVLNKILPHTMDLSKYGNQLETKTENGLITYFNYKNNSMDLSSLVFKNNPNKDFILKDNIKIYRSEDDKYIIAVKPTFTPNKEHDINVFTINGNHVLNLKDT